MVLIKAGAGVNFINHQQNTPLTYAQKFFPAFVEVLINLGAKYPQTTGHQVIESTVIKKPKIGITYHLKNPKSVGGEITISLYGDNVETMSSIDLASGVFTKDSNKEKIFNILDFNAFSFISKELLPADYKKENLSPILLWNSTLYPNRLIKPAQLTMYLNKSSLRGLALGGVVKGYQFIPQNSYLQKNLQTSVSNIPLFTGEYPILLPENRPNVSTLEKIYQDFIHYNEDEKLKIQYQASQGYCHIRAHFASILLSWYGIESVKVYKTWNFEQWKPYYDKDAWGFHCATMVIDDQNHAYIWDPWVGLNKHLLTLKQWTSYSNEPTPMKLIITNRGVVGDFNGRNISGINFMINHNGEYINPLQAMMCYALPNRPQPPLFKLSGKDKYLFFKAHKVKDKEQATQGLRLTNN
ncbi:Uncharacterised protein [Legionella beliardensis]|uniref:Protein glutaminase domain-containing protein n=1 Tax=Legionella beliardensis TaxID=91822 RepID=A0A378I3M4_9GAMM|nr:protein-glutamine glutaminase family protein [Legionella beliardensis]STX29301.1 Uncharacterised protein [Legionella beliardensis]